MQAENYRIGCVGRMRSPLSNLQNIACNFRRTLYHNTQRSDFRKGTIFCMVKRKSVIWCIHG